jgi:uncharacterized protein (TIGR02145 family)
VRAYAINSSGTAYGNQVQFTTASSGGGSIVSNPGPGVSFGGYNYSTILLGNGQEWMSENLRATTYANGDPIPNVTVDAQWTALTTGAWCYYNNDPQYENPYGKLYNWYTVADPRNVCPNGWHVPDETDWNLLVKYLDPSADTSCVNCNQNSIAGGMMKSTGTQYWLSPNAGATNQSGFSGLPAGFRDFYGAFNNIGGNGYWWGATETSSAGAWQRRLYYLNGIESRGNDPKYYGFSVRCLRD